MTLAVTASVVSIGNTLFGSGGGSVGQSNSITGEQIALAQDQQGKQDWAFKQLQQLMTNPGGFQPNNASGITSSTPTGTGGFFDNPVYTSARDQGLQGVSRQMAAMGYSGSGNMATALMGYGQTFGQQQLLSQEQLLAGMSGTGFNPSSALGGASSSNQQSFSNTGSLLASLGYMTGGGGSSGISTIGNFLGGLFGTGTGGGGSGGSPMTGIA